MSGQYTIQLYKGNIDILERESDSALFAPELRSLVTSGWDQRDSGPATKIHVVQYEILSGRGMKTD